MRTHIRMDGIKVFEEEDKILSKIVSKSKVSKKSDAWREALRVWDVAHSLEEENEYLKTKIDEMSQKLDDIYDKLNVLLK